MRARSLKRSDHSTPLNTFRSGKCAVARRCFVRLLSKTLEPRTLTRLAPSLAFQKRLGITP
eukprot:6200626-Pleurochrysis_carterae.AAC.1